MLFQVTYNSGSIIRQETPPVEIEPNAFGRADELTESRVSVVETRLNRWSNS